MRKLIACFLALLPSFLHVALRRLFGAKIGRGAKIHFGSVILTSNLEMGANAEIGPFCFVQALQIKLGESAKINALVFSVCSEVSLGDFALVGPIVFIKGTLDPKCRLSIGDHSKIFTFCFLEPGEGITIGKQVGIGGLGLLFTHGSWVNYLNGGPLRFAPIVIEDNVWIPWRCMIFPGVTVGKNSIVVVPGILRRSVPPDTYVAAPAVEAIKPYEAKSDPATVRARALEIIHDYGMRLNRMRGEGFCQIGSSHIDFGSKIALSDSPEVLGNGDLMLSLNEIPPSQMQRCLGEGISVLHHPSLTLYRSTTEPYVDEFLDYLLRWGIRLYVKQSPRSLVPTTANQQALES